MKLKKITILSVYILCLINGYSQNNLQKVNNISLKNHLKVYRNALNSGDYTTAIVALNYVVVESKNGQYSDSLAYLYYFSNNFYQSIFWCSEALKYKANNVGLLELKAICLKQTKQIFKAIEIYEHLMKISPSPVFAFNLIELQYIAKRLYECLITAKMVESLSFKDDMIYSYKVDETNTYSTSLKAAFYNYKGLVLFELKDSQEARIAFKMALSLDSSFILAKNNLYGLINMSNKDSENSSKDTKNDKKPIQALPSETELKRKE